MRLVVGASLLLVMNLSLAQVANPLQFKEELFDFGTIEEEKGPVVHEFLFTNSTKRPIRILNVKPSCGCTTPNWTRDPVLPGKTGFVQAKYDPKGRPGFFAKTLSITTDGTEPIVLQIKGTVASRGVDEPPTLTTGIGAWKLHSHSLNFGKVYRKDEYVIRVMEFQNGGEKPVKYLGRVDAPRHMSIEVEPWVVEPGKFGKIFVGYNGAIKNAYGFQSDNILIYTDDEEQPRKGFSVYATLEDDFSDINEIRLTNSPRLALSASTIDFGSIKKETESVKTVTVSNRGKSDLNLKSIQGNCTCLKVESSKNSLKPGESAIVTITFNPGSRSGTHQKAVTIYSDDPHKPVQRITLTSYVE